MHTTAPGVVFTDMDATLLDHDTYSFEPALGALDELKRRSIPLVLCSSKTRAELTLWQKRLEIEGPFICENGGGVILTGMAELAGRFPDRLDGSAAKVFGRDYVEIRHMLRLLKRNDPGKIKGFGDMDPAEVARLTGLPPEEAALAARRDFDEPFTWEPEPSAGAVKILTETAASQGFGVTRGGRFWHLTGDNDKGRALEWVMRELFPAAASLALGDSANDVEMLAAADRGVLVERPGGGHYGDAPGGIEKVRGVGPAGWTAAVLKWLETV